MLGDVELGKRDMKYGNSATVTWNMASFSFKLLQGWSCCK